METLFRDRSEAGKFLIGKLSQLANNPSLVVVALPRGGMPVAYEVARSFHASLDVFLAHKLGVPRHEELALGASASGRNSGVERRGGSPSGCDPGND
jgi:putative phosphoribosyl transferase